MSLIVVYLVLLILSQTITITTALSVERFLDPTTGLLVFICMYFAMFWLAWLVAVWLTVPGKRLGAVLGGSSNQPAVVPPGER